MPSSLRILIAAETYPPDVNGAARFAERLAGGLAGRGHDVHVVAPSPNGPPSKVSHDGVTVHGVRSHSYFMRPDFQVCMPWEVAPATAAVLEEINPDVVHTQAHMVLGRYVVKAAVRTGRPLVATNHFMPENLAAHAPVPRVLQRLGYRIAWKDLGRIFGQADVVTAPTPRAVELLQRYARLTDAFPVSCGIDADRYRRDPEPDVPNVLFVGRMDQEKRVDELIKAFAAQPTARRARSHRRRPGARGAGPRWSTSWASPTASGSTGSCPRTTSSRPTRAPPSSACPASPSCRASSRWRPWRPAPR